MAPAEKLPVIVDKPTPYTFDLALLVATDPNPLTIPSQPGDSREQHLADTTRDGAQSLINQLLTTCRITSTPEGVHLTLPPISTPLPREKPLPAQKPPTRWERFAKKKGLTSKTRDQRRNLAFDEETQQWRPKWGYGGMNKKGEDDNWLVEVDQKKEREAKEKGATLRSEGRRDRKERVRRNERSMRRNDRQAQQGKK
jgi:regulator of ribosome biosynthesis